MKGIAKIKGTKNPVVGQDSFYEVTEFHKGTVVINPNEIKWKLFKKKNGEWEEAKGNSKTGKKVSFNFSQKSYGIEVLVEAYLFNPEIATPPGLVVKPVLGPKKLLNAEILDANCGKITKPPKYGESITLKVTTENMLGETLKLSLWDRDTLKETGHDPTGNQLLWEGVSKKVDDKGIATAKVVLSANMLILAQKSMFDGAEHEYYLLVDAGKNKMISATKQVSSEVVLSPNPPAKKATPKAAPKEEPSILDQIAVKIKNAVGWDKITVEGITNAVVDVFSPEKPPSCEEKYCIKKGDKSELIREINIRLAGFGGNVPTDEFTDRTEKMVKQFQKDYMKVTETGKVCGNVLRAIDDFQNKFIVDINQSKCPCGECTGFGNGKYPEEKNNSSILEKNRKYEYPGMHRIILWTQRAIQFYLSTLEKDKKLSVGVLFSGYRCNINNTQKGRSSTNHMGKASDLHIYGGTGDREKNANAVRDLLVKYSGAKYRWNDQNVIALEADNRNGTASDFKATTWVHYDVRTFELKYLEDKYFAKTMVDCNGKNMIVLASELGFQKTCICNPTKATSVEAQTTKPSTTCEDKFKKVAPIILKHEGGYVNDPDDSGGETNKGITIGTFKSFAKEDLGIEPTSENLKKITDEQATIIYRKRYWEPKGFCEILDDKVSLMIYDWTITSGGAVKQVQKLLKSEFSQNINDDGGMGPKTIKAINDVEDQGKLLKRIGEIRKEYYTNLAIKDGVHTKNYKFLAGWHNRVDDCL